MVPDNYPIIKNPITKHKLKSQSYVFYIVYVFYDTRQTVREVPYDLCFLVKQEQQDNGAFF